MPQSPRTAFRVLTDDVDRRVDRVVRRLLPRLPLSRLYQALREGDIRVNGARVSPATRTREADLIRVDPALAASGGAARAGLRGTPTGPSAHRRRPATGGPRPALPVLYRDADTMIVDKPAGLAVHGDDDSVLARLAECGERGERTLPRRQALSFTPAPVHQLDRITSGALVVALTLAAARSWSAALRSGEVVKLYLAAVAGDVRTPPGGTLWEDRLLYDRRTRRARRDADGAPARARVWTVARADAAPRGQSAATLLLVRLHTGRRHQIRAQAAARGHALLGDVRYAATARRDFVHSDSAYRDLADGSARQASTRPDRARRGSADGFARHGAAYHGRARGGPASAPGAGWPVLHAAAIGNDAPAHGAAVVAPLPADARRAIERHFGPAAVRRARAAVARHLTGGPTGADAGGRSGRGEHG